MSSLDAEVSRENGKFVTSIYGKPTFCGVARGYYFLHTKQFGMLYTSVYRCFTLCSD